MASAFGNRWAVPIALFVLSVAVRALYLYGVHNHASLTLDEQEYYEPARHLAEGSGYAMVVQQSQDGIARPTAYRTPGVAGILAIAFLTFGPGIGVARWTCILVASLSSPLVYGIGRRIGSPLAATLAGVGCCIYPSWVHHSVLVLSEPVYIPGLLGALLLTDWLTRSESRWRWLGIGMAWGMLTLVRPHALPCCGLLSLYWATKVPLSRVALVPIGFAMILAPWTIRNAIVLGHPVLLATEAGETLLGSNNPDTLHDPAFSGMWKSPMAIPEYRSRLEPIQDEVERDREQSRMAVEFLRSHPEAIPELALRKLWRWLTPITNSGVRNQILVLASYGTLLVLLALGLVRGSIRHSQLLVGALAITVASCVITAVYWGNLTRGRMPIEIVWLPWASLAFCEIFASTPCPTPGNAEAVPSTLDGRK